MLEAFDTFMGVNCAKELLWTVKGMVVHANQQLRLDLDAVPWSRCRPYLLACYGLEGEFML